MLGFWTGQVKGIVVAVFCLKCESECAGDDEFCRRCGNRLCGEAATLVNLKTPTGRRFVNWFRAAIVAGVSITVAFAAYRRAENIDERRGAGGPADSFKIESGYELTASQSIEDLNMLYVADNAQRTLRRLSYGFNFIKANDTQAVANDRLSKFEDAIWLHVRIVQMGAAGTWGRFYRGKAIRVEDVDVDGMITAECRPFTESIHAGWDRTKRKSPGMELLLFNANRDLDVKTIKKGDRIDAILYVVISDPVFEFGPRWVPRCEVVSSFEGFLLNLNDKKLEQFIDGMPYKEYPSVPKVSVGRWSYQADVKWKVGAMIVGDPERDRPSEEDEKLFSDLARRRLGMSWQ